MLIKVNETYTIMGEKFRLWKYDYAGFKYTIRVDNLYYYKKFKTLKQARAFINSKEFWSDIDNGIKGKIKREFYNG